MWQPIIQFISPSARLLHDRWRKRPFVPPQKAVIFQPGTIRDVMLTTPLFQTLLQAYPETRFDWVVQQGSRLAISSHPSVKNLWEVTLGKDKRPVAYAALLDQVRRQQYDTCFIPATTGWLRRLALDAGIGQRVGLWQNGRGWSLTVAASSPVGEAHTAVINMSIARTIQIFNGFSRPAMRFFPADAHRQSITERLVDELNWLGDRPLILINPGAGQELPETAWPLERFVLLCNRLKKRLDAQLVLVGESIDQKVASEVSGMVTGGVSNWVGTVTLGEIGALAEIADLYVGSCSGVGHVTAAMGCRTIMIYGPTDPRATAPYAPNESQVVVLYKGREEKRPFAWADGVGVEEVAETAVRLLAKSP